MFQEAEQFDADDTVDDEQHHEHKEDIEGVGEDGEESVEHLVSQGYFIEHYVKTDLHGM